MTIKLIFVVIFPLLAVSAFAQVTHHVALSYNFNGIAHAGEAGLPDDLNGFRSISDRALDFSGGVPGDPLLDAYDVVASAGVLDVVHLGNRNTVDNGNWAFDAVADGDQVGVQPSWLTTVDQSGPQTTVLGTPILLSNSSRAEFLYQISNGGGSFDVTFTFQSGTSVSETLSGPDWFGGPYLGTANVDQANPGSNLSISEADVDLGGSAGQVLVEITFANGSNAIGGCAILAANVSGADASLGTTYCTSTLNSSGGAATIWAQGSNVVADDDLTLLAQPVPDQPGIFYLGSSQVQIPFGDGHRCVGGSVIFLGPGAASGNVLTHVVSLTTPPLAGQIVAGSTWNFQAWFRDPAAAMSGFNLSNGLQILFQ